MTRQEEVIRALAHLQTARRLLRDALALRPLQTVNRAIRQTEELLVRGQAVQPRLALEAEDPVIQ